MRLLVLAALFGMVLTADQASQVAAVDTNGTDAIEVFFPGWQDSHLTVAVYAGEAVPDELVAATRDAIATWDATLRATFGGAITLTDVTGDKGAMAKADIRYNLSAGATGGTVFDARALCSAAGCHQVLGQSHVNIGGSPEVYTSAEAYFIALHELGHTLGLGHAQPIQTSVDLMGYGWDLAVSQPAISACDLAALAVVWDWVLTGSTTPTPPAVSEVAC